MDPHLPEMDPIDAFLNQPTRSEATDCLQLSVFQRTARVLRHRRWLRRTGLTAGLASCYAAGILTMWLAFPSTPPKEAVIVQVPKESAPAPKPSAPPDSPQPESALAMEWHALDSTEPRPDLFRQAGDQYMSADDLESAMRCYRGALESASPEDLQISPNDNWLLIELKKAKQKEIQ